MFFSFFFFSFFFSQPPDMFVVRRRSCMQNVCDVGQRWQDRQGRASLDITTYRSVCSVLPAKHHRSLPHQVAAWLDCSVHRHLLRLSALSYLTTSPHSCPKNSVSFDYSVRGRLLHISALSYLTASHRSCPMNSVSFDCSVHWHLLHISALSQVISPQLIIPVQRTQSRLTVLSIRISSRFLLCLAWLFCPCTSPPYFCSVLISPQVIGPVQRTQSRLTALSLDTSSIFLLCLISPQVIIPVQRIQSRLTALSIDIPTPYFCSVLSHHKSSYIPVQRIQSRLTALSIDNSSVFLLCLIPPQVIVPVQRIQSRLTALSIDISIFLLCLKLSHQNSSFLSNELNLAWLFCPYVYPPNFCSGLSYLTTSHRSYLTTSPVQRTQSRLTALSIDTSSIFLLCLKLFHHIIPVQRIQSCLTALSLHIPSIFLLGLIPQVINPVQRPQFHSICIHFACFNSQLG